MLKRGIRCLLIGSLTSLLLTLCVSQGLAKDGVYDVVYPIGRSTLELKPLAPHLPDLNGKTICGSGHSYEGDEGIAAIVDLLKKDYPDLKFIPGSELPDEVSTQKEIAAFQALLKKKGCDAVLSGTGC